MQRMYRFLFISIGAPLLFVLGCSSSSPVTEPAHQLAADSIGYTLIYYIHGDSDYLYHDGDGTALQANEKALAEAQQLARKASSGEVFIFYQQPRRKVLGLFPRSSGTMYQYANGRQLENTTYRSAVSGLSFLEAEQLLFHEHTIAHRSGGHRNIFLFYGHEIPDASYRGYHQSHGGLELSASSLTGGLRRFLNSADQRFDLVVLSSCSNGTPLMAQQLQQVSKLMVASPQNLHLSYMDSTPLRVLENNQHLSTQDLADSIAVKTYRRLSERILTTITVSVYDLDVVGSYIDELNRNYTRYMLGKESTLHPDNVDCGTHSFFNEDLYTAGVKTWHTPSKFGRTNNKQHSGWGCSP